MQIENIQQEINNDNYFLSKHADDERKNDNITILELEQAILNGYILEKYDDDIRGSSCLIVGFTDEGKPIHVVCGTKSEVLVIITVYIPTAPKFITPFQRRKR
ncbi:MAG: DUF4258 domain-containing protein [Gammaproteobacteria bacterium]|nr:MAG: DUF4258 domain-containing protein [Gammaproteobacteria bacterium]